MTVGGTTFTVTQNGSSATCAYTIFPTSFSFDPPGHTPFGNVSDTGTVAVTTSSGCDWSATSTDSWITITNGSSGTGNGTVFYTASVNATGSTRMGTITIGGKTFTVTQNVPITCAYTISPTSAPLNSSGNTGEVAVTGSPSSCAWSAASNVPWITITQGSQGTGPGTVSYSVSANATGSPRTGTMTIGGETFTVAQDGSLAYNLYFPHIDTSLPWQTEIALVNTGAQMVTGTLRALRDDGQLVETKPVTLSPRGRTQVDVAGLFANDTYIGYIIFEAASNTVEGYTKFYQGGLYRTAIPAIKEVNASGILSVPHIASNAEWWTALSLVNTTSAAKELTITINGQSKQLPLAANERKVFTIAGLFDDQPQPDMQSAVITNASGVIGMAVFSNSPGGKQQTDGVLLTDKTASTLYYPHVVDGDWWTGIVAYNPSESPAPITITPYDALGTALTVSTSSIPAKGKYIGTPAELGLPAETAWFKIVSSTPALRLLGFEFFGAANGSQLAAYAGGGGTGAKTGVFPKIEKNGGWTGIAFVNTEADAASVTLTAYRDNGDPVATGVLPVGGRAREARLATEIFSQDISSATYIGYSSNRTVVGFQLNGSADGTMLDGLPALGGTD